MGVQHEERRRLAGEMVEDEREDGVLDDVGEIPRMESVPVVHGRALKKEGNPVENRSKVL